MNTSTIHSKYRYLLAGMLISTLSYASPEALLDDYQNQGAADFSLKAGQAAWEREYTANSLPLTRSCSSCHGDDLSQPGKHIKTGKTIKAMKPSSNPERLSDVKKVEKWFRRNCRWTMGRECTAQEKGDFVRYINQP